MADKDHPHEVVAVWDLLLAALLPGTDTVDPAVGDPARVRTERHKEAIQTDEDHRAVDTEAVEAILQKKTSGRLPEA